MELWDRYADHFPVREHIPHLNHAGVAPLCLRAADAMKNYADEALEWGSWHYDRWLATYLGLRTSTARRVGSRAAGALKPAGDLQRAAPSGPPRPTDNPVVAVGPWDRGLGIWPLGN